MIWPGPSVLLVLFCFVLNLLFWKDLWNSLSLCCLLQDLYHRLAMKLSASLNLFHRLCIKRNGFFLPFFLSLTLSIWGQRIPLKKAYRSQHIMEEVRVCLLFFHRPHKAWSCCYQYHYFVRIWNRLDSVALNIETPPIDCLCFKERWDLKFEILSDNFIAFFLLLVSNYLWVAKIYI